MQKEQYQTKTNLVRQLVKNGKHKHALRIAKDFRLGIDTDSRTKMQLAYECLVHPKFFEELGFDTKQTVKTGVDTLLELYCI